METEEMRARLNNIEIKIDEIIRRTEIKQITETFINNNNINKQKRDKDKGFDPKIDGE